MSFQILDEKTHPWVHSGNTFLKNEMENENQMAEECCLLFSFFAGGRAAWTQLNHGLMSWSRMTDNTLGHVYMTELGFAISASFLGTSGTNSRGEGFLSMDSQWLMQPTQGTQMAIGHSSMDQATQTMPNVIRMSSHRNFKNTQWEAEDSGCLICTLPHSFILPNLCGERNDLLWCLGNQTQPQHYQRRTKKDYKPNVVSDTKRIV